MLLYCKNREIIDYPFYVGGIVWPYYVFGNMVNLPIEELCYCRNKFVFTYHLN